MGLFITVPGHDNNHANSNITKGAKIWKFDTMLDWLSQFH